MKINRQIKIIYVLLDKRSITAKELAQRFNVSQRTIYRDIDDLSLSGIPVYTTKGSNGGIHIMDDYTIDKSFLTKEEQLDLLSSIQGLKSIDALATNSILDKLNSTFQRKQVDWIEVDFSPWGSDQNEKIKFELCKGAIINKKIISFKYYSTYQSITNREVAPLKLLFKGHKWYLHGYCYLRNDERLFKLKRVKDLLITEKFHTKVPALVNIDNNEDESRFSSKIKLLISPAKAYRVYDEFSLNEINKTDQGYLIEVEFPIDDWLLGYILSFGEDILVIEPSYLKTAIADKISNMQKVHIKQSFNSKI